MRALVTATVLLGMSGLLFLGGCGDGEAAKSDPSFRKEKASTIETARMSRKQYQYEAPPGSAIGSIEFAIAPTPIENTAESYDVIHENEFVESLANPKSTFSIDVDTASYSNVRRMINDMQAPPKGAVRIEELINYFDYQYASPHDDQHPFHVHADLAKCPWNEENQLVRIALKGKEFTRRKRPDCNLVFLLDVSGSMSSARKLPLVKKAMRMLVSNLDRNDQIAIVVYAGASGIVLPSTSATNDEAIMSALSRLHAGGSTNGGGGLDLAYQVAAKNFIDDGVNRVILCTDGDFNVGVTNQAKLVDLIKKKARSGISLSVLGFGAGNLKDDTMESLADKGNGNYAYIDSQQEARKALIDQMEGTLMTIAKDVKIQVDFNPARVAAYRLIGYENRVLQNEDFADDKKDAGEIGAGHTVTALYEVVPAGEEMPKNIEDGSEFVVTKVKADALDSDTVLKVHLRYKQPEGSESNLFTVALNHDSAKPIEMPTGEFKFAASVAAYGMLLRESEFAGDCNWSWVIDAANSSIGDDRKGYRTEFVKLARQASLLK